MAVVVCLEGGGGGGREGHKNHFRTSMNWKAGFGDDRVTSRTAVVWASLCVWRKRIAIDGSERASGESR